MIHCLVLSVGLLFPSPAEACSVSPCSPGTMAPSEGSVPASLPGVEWRSYGGGLATVVAVREDPTETPVEIEFDGTTVRFVEPPVVGGIYRIDGSIEGCPGAGATSRFAVDEGAAIPTDLGALTATPIGAGPVPIPTYRGSCSVEVDAMRASLALALDPGAEPWASALVYETLVDGVPWRPAISLAPSNDWARAVDQVYTICGETAASDAPDGVTPGAHTIEMRARVAGSEATFSTTSAEVTLACAAAADAGAGDAGPASVPGGASGCHARRSPDSWLAMVALAALGALVRRRGLDVRTRLG